MIKVLKIIHVADNHIGAALKSSSYAGDFALRRQREIINTLFKVVDYANENDVDYILHSGDLFDTPNMKISDVKSVFRKLGEFNGQVLLIAGNHDFISEDSFWKTINYNDNIYLFNDEVEKIEFKDDNLVVYGHSWNRSYISEKLLNEIDELDKTKRNILIAHGDIYTKESNYLPIDKENLISKGFDYVALGHIHKHEFVTERIAYSGSLEPLDFGETGKHGFIYLEIDDQVKTKFIPFSEREFIIKEINLNGELSDNDIYNLISGIDSTENKQKNFYRVIFKGRYNHHVNLDVFDLNNIFKDEFTYIEFKNNANLDFDIEQLKEENKDNVIGLFIKKFEDLDFEDEITKKAFNTGLELLLNSKEGLLWK